MLQDQEYPILEFDDAQEAVLEPNRLFKTINVPAYGIICFYQDVITELLNQKKLNLITGPRREITSHPLGATAIRPIYELAYQNRNLLVFHPGVGSAVASAMLEEVIALGCKNFIACSSAGVLDGKISVGQIVIPTSAVRDEGVSYHYLPPGREVKASAEGINAIINVLTTHNCKYRLGKTWTTDAIFRETAAKIHRRKTEGCLVVEMEAASMFAVAVYRGVRIAQILYGGDDVSNLDWNARLWSNRAALRKKLFWLAVEACLQL